jgi:c-di-GMP-binding flagellar brake protein YcgR
VPAKRSRTLQWRRCLQQIQERNGAIEIVVARAYEDGEVGNHLAWRVRVLALNEDEITVEQPSTLGQAIPLRPGVSLVGIIAIGQNRWTFGTVNLGLVDYELNNARSTPAMRIRMPESVQRCQRRNYYRVETAAISLPKVELWPLLDPKSVVLAERANELEFAVSIKSESDDDTEQNVLDGMSEDVMPEVGPGVEAVLLNIGGGGMGLSLEPDQATLLGHHKLYWVRLSLPPELTTPICASAKLAHTHMQSDQRTYAGLSFDFTFNPGHQRFVVDQICRYIAIQQRFQLQRQLVDHQQIEDDRRSA